MKYKVIFIPKNKKELNFLRKKGKRLIKQIDDFHRKIKRKIYGRY